MKRYNPINTGSVKQAENVYAEIGLCYESGRPLDVCTCEKCSAKEFVEAVENIVPSVVCPECKEITQRFELPPDGYYDECQKCGYVIGENGIELEPVSVPRYQQDDLRSQLLP